MENASKYTRLRVHSSVDRLPEESRELLEEMLADAANGLSYKKMAEIIEEQCGIRLSTSAIGRYAKRYMREVKQIDQIMQRMRMVSEYAREHGTADASMSINALIQEGLMRRILDGADDIADMDIEDALKYSIQAQRAAVYEYRYRDDRIVREAADAGALEDDRMNWLRSVLREHPEVLAVIETGRASEESHEGITDTRENMDAAGNA